jgi:hypothetical protein
MHATHCPCAYTPHVRRAAGSKRDRFAAQRAQQQHSVLRCLPSTARRALHAQRTFSGMRKSWSVCEGTTDVVMRMRHTRMLWMLLFGESMDRNSKKRCTMSGRIVAST